MPNCADSYSSLEEALKAMMREKMKAPNMIVMLYPADEVLNTRWDDAGHMVGVFASYSNNPSISIIDDNDCMDDDRDLMKDLDEYVAAKAAKIKELYGVEGNEHWELTYLDTSEGNKSEEVYLVIEPLYAETVEAMLDKFNMECKDAGFNTKLILDRQTMVIEGSFVGKDSNFFNRMKINSRNKKAHDEFRKFLISLEPYLWKLSGLMDLSSNI
ncbi:MAG: hypothetical protein K2K75_10530 [Muribaculaceae bacterium]|nr:hypothetical protein [Muribaculaceae bacterium]